METHTRSDVALWSCCGVPLSQATQYGVPDATSAASAGMSAGLYVGSDVMVKSIQHHFHADKFAWFTGLPLLVQAFLISFVFDFGQYWMHRGMHNWYPLWLPHSVHHYITQMNINKGAVGNPVELFLIGLGIGGFFDFVPRA